MAESLDFTSRDTSGLLLVGHGTRDERGLEEARALAGKVRAICPDRVVELCFLELATPDIAAGVERLVRTGVRHIRVMPLLLLAAGHVKRDIPAAVEAAVNALDGAFGELRVDYCTPFGCHDLVVELSERRYREALAGDVDVSQEESLLILVARGNRDPQAQRELARFAEQLCRRCGGLPIETAYLAMAEPRLDVLLGAALAGAAASGHRRIVVLPHFLFAGELLGRVQSQVAALAAAHRQVRCMVAQHLGPSQLLAEAVREISGNRQCHNSRAAQWADVPPR